MIIPLGFASAAWILSGPAGTEPFVTTCGVDLSGAGGGPLLDVANHLQREYVANFKSSTDDSLSMEYCLLTFPSAPSTATIRSDDAATSGTRTSRSLPISTGLLMEKSTALAGRRGRGRMFIPGILGADDVDLTGQIDSGYVSAFQTLIESFYTRLTSAGIGVGPCPPVILHSVSGVAPTPVTAFNVAKKVGTQRKRLR